MKLFRKAKKTSKNPVCSCCGLEIANEIPALTFKSPAYWQDEFYKSKNSELTSDTCIIEGENYFIRCTLDIPIKDHSQPMSWGVWVSVSKQNFERYLKVYGKKSELKEKPYFGWFSNVLPGYSDTLQIKCSIFLQGNKNRPLVLLDHSNQHLLCQQQHKGITLVEAHQIYKNAING